MVTQSSTAGIKELRALAALAHSDHPFLTVFLNTEDTSLPADLQARLTDLLWQAHERYAGSKWEPTAERERERVLSIIPSLKPVGAGLVVASSEEAGMLEVYWLLDAVEDHVRVGLGVDALPVLDLIEENQPVAVAFVENDKARLLLTAAGRVIEAQHFSADVPGRERAGGWHAAGYDRHRKEMARKHLKDVAAELGAFRTKHPFDRLIVAGPADPLAVFKGELTQELAGLVIAEMGLDAHASDADIASRVRETAEQAERDSELRAVKELVVAAEKQQGAMLGAAETLQALHDHELHLLFIDSGVELRGTLCLACDRLLPEETHRCPGCEGPLETLDLRDELPRHISTKEVQLEIVHGEAATELWAHGGIGGRLKIHPH